MVMIALSGGVDSAVSAWLLKRAGWRVEALFARNWPDDEYCTARSDLESALEIGALLDIPVHQIDMSDAYTSRVFASFLEEHRKGRTPNPDILCNREIKFDLMWQYAKRLGADFLATGHYARILKRGSEWELHKGVDPAKDQSYFLCAIKHEILPRILFPAGHLTKSKVRRIAMEQGFPNHDRPGTSGICFVGERPYADFVKHYLPALEEGPMYDDQGRLLGKHQGLGCYTIGQRSGLGIGGQKQTSSEPWYVLDKNPDANSLIIGQGRNHPRLYHRALIANSMNWLMDHPPVLPMHCQASSRYRQQPSECMIERAIHDNGEFPVIFDAPQRALTPGQAVVFYQGSRCLGGGVIDRLRSPSLHKQLETESLHATHLG